MASTNKTTNYDLSQYIGTDKPTYLVDYNQDMAKIDAGITGAKNIADANAVNIGDLDNLSTTSKADLVNAINEVDSNLSTVSSQVGDNKTDIGALQGDVGNKANLKTTAKNNLVSAINEVNDKADDNSSDIGNLSNLGTTSKTDLVSAINEIEEKIEELDNYSTNEEITGKKWIDGKPIYRKTIYIPGNITYTGDSAYIDTNITNIDVLIDFKGQVYDSTSGHFPLPYVDLGRLDYGISMSMTNDNKIVIVNKAYGNPRLTKFVFNLEYTKTV